MSFEDGLKMLELPESDSDAWTLELPESDSDTWTLELSDSIFDKARYRNSNMCIMGKPGDGFR